MITLFSSILSHFGMNTNTWMWHLLHILIPTVKTVESHILDISSQFGKPLKMFEIEVLELLLDQGKGRTPVLGAFWLDSVVSTDLGRKLAVHLGQEFSSFTTSFWKLPNCDEMSNICDSTVFTVGIKTSGSEMSHSCISIHDKTCTVFMVHSAIPNKSFQKISNTTISYLFEEHVHCWHDHIWVTPDEFAAVVPPATKSP